jgi:hypothetical protein
MNLGLGLPLNFILSVYPAIFPIVIFASFDSSTPYTLILFSLFLSLSRFVETCSPE